MAFLDRIKSVFGFKPQRRAISPFDHRLIEIFSGGPSLSGVSVSRASALSIPAVWGAVDTFSKTLASLPFDLYQRTESGAEIASSHPNYYTTKFEPSPFQTGYNFRAALFAQAAFGDAYARIYRNGVGRVTRLTNLDSLNVLPFYTSDGDLMYRVVHVSPVMGGRTYEETLYPWEILHVKGLTLSGIVGEDVIARQKETFGMAIAATQYGAAFFGNGAHVSGVVEAGQGFTPEQVKRMEDVFHARYGGTKNTGKTPFLDSGATYKKVGLTPQEATLNESRTFQRREIATVFGIPLHLIQDLGDSTFNNVETMSTQFVTLCVRPWAVRFEQEFAVKTLTEQEKRSGRFFYRVNLNGLLRGDTAARTAMYKSGIESGWLLRNDARELEDFNRLPGLDKPIYPANMNVLDEQGRVEQAGTNTPANSNNDQNDEDAPEASA